MTKRKLRDIFLWAAKVQDEPDSMFSCWTIAKATGLPDNDYPASPAARIYARAMGLKVGHGETETLRKALRRVGDKSEIFYLSMHEELRQTRVFMLLLAAEWALTDYNEDGEE